jgi:SAM-dependent methyltransferase
MAGCYGVRVVGVDPSVAMLERARAKPDPRVSYRRMIPGELGFLADRSVAAAHADFVFVCEPDLDQLHRLVAEVHRVLRPGGRFTVLDSNPATLGVRFPGLRQGEPGVVYTAGDALPVDLQRRDGSWSRVWDFFWPLETYEALLREAGFSRVRHRTPVLTDVDQHAVPPALSMLTAARQAAPFVLVTGERGPA